VRFFGLPGLRGLPGPRRLLVLCPLLETRRLVGAGVRRLVRPGVRLLVVARRLVGAGVGRLLRILIIDCCGRAGVFLHCGLIGKSSRSLSGNALGDNLFGELNACCPNKCIIS